jgi:hypothetical protein
MGETQIIDGLREKRSELAATLSRLEGQIVQQRANLTHLDATMRLFDPDRGPEAMSGAGPQRTRSAWFRPGECLRLIYDVLREAPQPMTTRALADRVMSLKAITTADERTCALVQKTVLGSLSRAKGTIQRAETAGLVSWQIA